MLFIMLKQVENSVYDHTFVYICMSGGMSGEAYIRTPK